jgi:hypothetical protein
VRVEELLISDPQERAVHWLALEQGEYRPLARSGLVELGPRELSARIDWPALAEQCAGRVEMRRGLDSVLAAGTA